MPFEGTESDLKLSEDLLQVFDNIFGLHPGYRPAHAKGVYCTGVFTPAHEAASLTRAPHILRDSTPVTVRFSDATGIPAIPDNDPNASPRGMAIRFHLGEREHTDIVAQSHDGFPVATGQEFLEFLRAVAASGADAPKPTPIEAFLGGHPKALEFVMAPKPIPSSFAHESFFSVNAFGFTNAEGVSRYGRYRIRPEAGGEYPDANALAAKTADFLFDELAARLAKGPVRHRILVQVAEPGDATDDATAHWPEDRRQVEFGTITLTARAAEDEETRRTIFDPIPRLDGIERSGDPLLAVRANLYLLSGRRRRSASAMSRSAAESK